MPLADRVRIVELTEPMPMSYHVAFNHRKAAADACDLLIATVAKIVPAPVAQSSAFA
jgi:hypothetical protein